MAVMDTDEEPYVPAHPAYGRSSAYVQIFNSVPGGATYYARVGWTVSTASGLGQLYWLVEHLGFVGFVPRTPGSTKEFRVVWNSAPLGGNGGHSFTWWAGIDRIAWQDMNWSPDEAQLGGIHNNRASQFPGRSTNKMEMKSSPVHVNGSWIGFSSGQALNGFSTATWTNVASVTGSSTWYRLWDADC